MINEHASQWLGFPVKEYLSEDTEKPVTDAACTIYRLRTEYESTMEFTELLVHYISNASVADTPGIIIGSWMAGDPGLDSSEIVQLLVGARESLRSLKGIFLGDVLSEECEVSWIVQSDVSPLLGAYPALAHLRIRGSCKLSLGGRVRHEGLKSLIIETGGLSPAVLQEVLSLDLPNLEHLELWIGTSEYGGDITVAELKPLLDGGLFPRLRHLGLRDAEIADAIAKAVATAPIVSRIESLDLSLGTLSDMGAGQLMKSEAVRKLKNLDLHHHYCSNETMAQLRRWHPAVNLDNQESADEDDRYVAVSE